MSRPLLGVVKNVPEFPFYNYWKVLKILSGPTIHWFPPKAASRPWNFLSTVWTEKKFTKFGVWPGPAQDFQGSVPKTLTHPHSEFFHSTFLDWKNFTKAFKTLFFCLFIENGSQREERAGTRRSLRLAEQRNRKRTAAGILDDPIPTLFANPVFRLKRYIRVPEIKIRKAERGNQRTRGDAWIEG